MGCWEYRASGGFGLPQYLLWCQQLHAEPLLAVFAGYVLQRQHVNAGSPEMSRYAEEALQEIEYVSGPADSEWGKRRAADGFPEPFHLTYVEIGNEDWFDRPAATTAGTRRSPGHPGQVPQAEADRHGPGQERRPDLYDDHYYRSPADGRRRRPLRPGRSRPAAVRRRAPRRGRPAGTGRRSSSASGPPRRAAPRPT